MEYYELSVKCRLKINLHFTESNFIIAKNINYSMLYDDDLKHFHESIGYKYLVFSNFYPIEKDKYYKKDKVYFFKLRTLDKAFSYKIFRTIMELKSRDLDVLSIDYKTIRQGHIDFIETITAAIVTIDNKPWTINDDISILIRRLQDNLEKKYNDYYDTKLEPEQSFIESIKVLNRVPLGYKYKDGITLLGNKFYINVHNDYISQELACMALACSLAEKGSSIGAGFCRGGRR